MKKMLEKFSIVTMVLIMLLVSVDASLAMEASKQKLPLYGDMGLRYAETQKVDLSLDAYGLDLEADLIIRAKDSNADIRGRLSLQKYNRGNWYTVKSWGFDDTGSVSLYKEYKGSKNKYYRLKLNANVNGERISKTSRIRELR